MTDDLAKRWDGSVATARDAMEQAFDAADEMADRIEALEQRLDATKDKAEAAILDLMAERDRAEARLAKAVEALRLYACACDGGFCHANGNFCGGDARATLAEIEGGKKDD